MVLRKICILLVFFFLASCATEKEIEYRDRDVYHYINNVVHDTLVDRVTDSVYFATFVNGDTVFQIKYKEKTRWRDRIVETHDTCWRDSVVRQYIEVTKEMTKIPKIYTVSLFISILCIIFAIIKLVRWLQIH